LRGLGSIQAASIQLSVPILAAAAGMLLFSEPLTPRVLIAAAAVLGGLTLVLKARNLKSRA
jgi:drug/metabolite transporter (DMT)-like permease